MGWIDEQDSARMRVARFSKPVLCRQPRDHPTHRNEIRIGAVSGVQFGAGPVQFGPRLPGGGVIQVERTSVSTHRPTTTNPFAPDRNLVLLMTNVNLILIILKKNRKKTQKKSRRNWEFFSLFELEWFDSHRNEAKKNFTR